MSLLPPGQYIIVLIFPLRSFPFSLLLIPFSPLLLLTPPLGRTNNMPGRSARAEKALLHKYVIKGALTLLAE